MIVTNRSRACPIKAGKIDGLLKDKIYKLAVSSFQGTKKYIYESDRISIDLSRTLMGSVFLLY